VRPTAVAISEASPDDAAEISEFAIRTYVEAFGAGFRSDDLAYHLERSLSLDCWQAYLAHDHVLVAHESGRLVGYVQFGKGEVAGEVEVRRLYVDQASQGGA
jgi:hypothetical protein